MTIFTMPNENDFWQVAAEYRGQISKVQFKFAVPNMLKSGDSLSEELREIGKEVKGQEVNLDISRPNGGLTLVNDLIKNAIAYVNAGAGQAILKVKKKIVYSSRRSNLQKDVETDIDVSVADPKQVEDLSKKVFDK
jgi:hypothetical protein